MFENSDADVCPLANYVDTFINSGNLSFNLYQLPPIQRNAVWNIAQIERIWDSILRGYPIGSFLVSPRREKDKSRDFITGNQSKSEKNGYFLLDGQQRTRALLLGFQPSKNSRLWIDLDPNLQFDNIELNDRKFLLRVLTSYQPWGMSDRNPSDKLPQHEKMAARARLKAESIHYDYEIEIDTGTPTKTSNHFSWPIRAKLPVPFDALMQLCGGTSGTFVRPEWIAVLKLVPEKIEASINYQEPPVHYHQVLDALEKIISTDNSQVKTRTVVLLLQEEHHIEQRQVEVQDDMEVLFRRINSGGTVLQGEEMAYSLLKASWDGAYDMVSTIVQNPKVGYLLSSTSIVMAATRLARFLGSDYDIPNPSVANFRKWIGDKKDNKFLNIMKELLIHDIGGRSRFQNILEEFCDLVLYREHIPDDIGLPKKLLLSIKPTIFHPVLIWIDKININKEGLEANRTRVLRYLIYCLLTVDEHEKASKAVIDILRKITSIDFPDEQVYKALLEKQLSVPLPTPEQYSKPFETKVTGFLRDWKEAFDIDGDPFNHFRSWFWHNKLTLLWFQRECAARWFKGYDPTSDDAYDTPYDWDHIVPYSHLIGQGNYDFGSDDKENINKLWHARHRYINSVGNLRLWPYWANRSDNNRCHTEKLRLKEHSWNEDDEANKLNLASTDDFLRASAIPVIDRDIWLDSGGSPRNWLEQRRRSWQTAVENRAVFLYTTLYEGLRFSEWQLKE